MLLDKIDYKKQVIFKALLFTLQQEEMRIHKLHQIVHSNASEDKVVKMEFHTKYKSGKSGVRIG